MKRHAEIIHMIRNVRAILKRVRADIDPDVPQSIRSRLWKADMNLLQAEQEAREAADGQPPRPPENRA